jgi:hypothetical protein
MATVGQRLLVFEHAQTNRHALFGNPSRLGWLLSGKLVYIYFSTDPVSVTGAWAWCGGPWLVCRELHAVRVVCLSGDWLWKWKPRAG